MLVCLLLVTLIKMVNLIILQYLLSWPKFPLHNPSILGGKIFCEPYSLFLSLLISFLSKFLLTKQHIYSISILKSIILFPSSHFSLSPNGLLVDCFPSGHGPVDVGVRSKSRYQSRVSNFIFRTV